MKRAKKERKRLARESTKDNEMCWDENQGILAVLLTTFLILSLFQQGFRWLGV